jgi:23S rRNA pseudouridine955/2504/2580 synthase
VQQLVVAAEEAGQRVDNYLLRKLKGVPKSHVYRILRSGEVRVNSGRVDPTRRLEGGDRVRLPPIRMADRSAAAPIPVGTTLPVLFEDPALLVVNKPAGLAVHGGSGVSFGVIEQLRRQRPEARFLELVHRLDRETSGILLIAKKRSALTALHEALRQGGMDKFYLALVRGRFANRRQQVRLALHKYLTGEGERRVRVDAQGQAAHTVFTRRQRWNEFSLLQAELRTGRTHQIRVHLAHLGHAIAGDDKYGDFTWNRELQKLGLKRMFLHAARLDLSHPLSGEPLALEAPLPAELAGFLRALGPGELDHD